MKRVVIIILILFSLLLVSCKKENKHDSPRRLMDHLCFDGDTVCFQDENGSIVSIHPATGETGKVTESGKMYSLRDVIYVVDEDRICIRSGGVKTVIGTAPKNGVLIGVIDTRCFYLDGEQLIEWNAENSEKIVLYTFENADVVNYHFAVSSDEILIGTQDGLYACGFEKGQIRKIAGGYLTGLKAVGDFVYFVKATPGYDPLYKEGEPVTSFDGAEYYRYDHGQISLLATVDHVDCDRTDFTVCDGILFAIEENSERTRSFLWSIDEKGNKTKVELTEYVDDGGGIVANGKVIVFGSKSGLRLWKFDRESRSLEKLNVPE